MKTIFVPRSGACVGPSHLADAAALQRMLLAMPAEQRSRVRWVVSFLDSPLLAESEIAEMGEWLDLLGTVRQAGGELAQVRKLVSSFYEKQSNLIQADGETDSPRRRALEKGMFVRDLDRRRPRTGRIFMLADEHAAIEWSTGRLRQVALSRLLDTRRYLIARDGVPPLPATAAHAPVAISVGVVVSDLDKRRPRNGVISEVNGVQAAVRWSSGVQSRVAKRRLHNRARYRLRASDAA